MNGRENGARLRMILSMAIFGSIGIFRRYIDLPSGMIAFARGLIGTAFLLLAMKARGQKLNRAAIKPCLALILISGAALGFNWILLFEAYRYTSVAVATLCYYMAPVFVMLTAPFLLGEKLTLRKGLCAAALIGIALVSGIAGADGAISGRGIALGLGAAALYAAVIVLNKKITGVPAYDKTVLQLGTSAAVLIPYILLVEGVSGVTVTPVAGLMLLVVGVVHTGVAYALYFGAMDGLRAQTVALLGYIDPVIAIILSALLLHEPMGWAQIVGAALVLGGTVASELSE